MFSTDAVDIFRKKFKRLERENRKLKKALQYCADYAHPSIVQDVAKKALGKSLEQFLTIKKQYDSIRV